MLYTLQPLRKRAAEVLERHDVIAVLEARPAHNEAELLSSLRTRGRTFQFALSLLTRQFHPYG